MTLYSKIIRPLLFSLEGEDAHRVGMMAASLCECQTVQRFVGGWVRFDNPSHDHPSLAIQLAGLKLNAPIGIAAGFDKEGCAIGFGQSIGASHIEVGTVTLRPQPGNSRPRVFRLKNERAIVNRMGFPSSGVDAVLERLSRWQGRERTIRIGINIGKNKDTPLYAAVEEYRKLSQLVAPFADYICINVSSPNTPELRSLQEPDRLRDLLAACRTEVGAKPLFVKLSPDIEQRDLVPIVEVILEQQIDAIVATNTTISRDSCEAASSYQGGLSGAPLFERSVAFVAALYRELGSRIPLIGVGGIESSERALLMIAAGATALQLYTGIVFHGPSIIASIHNEIAEWLQRRRISELSSLIGHPELLDS
jgi:dihydroorotate dehydrogenase